MLPQLFAGRSSINRRTDFCIDPGAFIYLAVMILLIPAKWLAGALLAAAVHEVGHILSLYLLKIRINSITIGIRGTVILTEPMPPWKELLSALAGPAAGLLLLLIYPIFPHTAFCAMIQSVFNLLPVFPFDGWRILRCFVLMLKQGLRYIVLTLALDKSFRGDKLVQKKKTQEDRL